MKPKPYHLPQEIRDDHLNNRSALAYQTILELEKKHSQTDYRFSDVNSAKLDYQVITPSAGMSGGLANSAILEIRNAVKHGDFETSIALANKFLNSSRDATQPGLRARALQHRAFALACLERFTEARDTLVELVQTWPNDNHYYRCLGRANYILGDLPEATSAYSRAIELLAADASTHNDLGCVLFDSGRTKEALGAFLKAIELRPSYAVGHNNLGQAFFTLGELERSIHSYSLAIRHQETLIEAWNNRAQAREEIGEHENALKDYLEALHLKPDYSEALQGVARVYQLTGDLLEAANSLREAYALNSGDPTIRLNLANILLELGHTGEARAIFEDSMTPDPINRTAREDPRFYDTLNAIDLSLSARQLCLAGL